MRVGDLVLTRPEGWNGGVTPTDYQPVLNTFVTRPSELLHITVETAAGERETLVGKRIARYPHDNDTWLGGPHTIIANGEPPEPFAPNTKLSCLMLLANPNEFGRWTRPTDGAEVVFYDVFGLYTEERDLELREGLPKLLNRFQDRFISKTLDPQRPNVAL